MKSDIIIESECGVHLCTSVLQTGSLCVAATFTCSIINSAPTAMCFCKVDHAERLITACDGEVLLWSLGEDPKAERCVRLDSPPSDIAPDGLGDVRHVSACGNWSCTVRASPSGAYASLSSRPFQQQHDSTVCIQSHACVS